MKKERVQLEFEQYEVEATGIISSVPEVLKLKLHFKNLKDTGYPDQSTLRLIREASEEALIDKAERPELEFDL